MALVGTWLGGHVDPNILKIILGVGLFAVALSFLRSPDHGEISVLDKHIRDTFSGEKAKTCLVSRDGQRICYKVCNKTEGMLIAGVGGLFVGMISTGLGELNGYFLLRRCKVPSKVSVATSVFIVSFTALTASIGHFIHFVQEGSSVLKTVLSIVMFTVPGVIIGAQAGSKIAHSIPQRVLEIVLGVLFIGVALLTIGEIIL